MASLGIRLRAAASVALGAAAGVLTNITTSSFSWVLTAALCTVVAVWMVLVWIDNAGSRSSNSAGRTSINVLARDRSTVSHNTLEANQDATVEVEAIKEAHVKRTEVSADSANVRIAAGGNAIVENNRVIARRGEPPIN
ncbi:hypothetical protein [Streptomyces sp. NPDC101166]|uniref:hypothetical protein n=1 Tax=Streptomyces sp. NPDC101166 TaxID=3366120 RepID=UPI0037FBAC6B